LDVGGGGGGDGGVVDGYGEGFVSLESRCASAKYMLLASGANTFKPDAFDAASKIPKPALTS
jgi:hypothetical protein